MTKILFGFQFCDKPNVKSSYFENLSSYQSIELWSAIQSLGDVDEEDFNDDGPLFTNAKKTITEDFKKAINTYYENIFSPNVKTLLVVTDRDGNPLCYDSKAPENEALFTMIQRIAWAYNNLLGSKKRVFVYTILADENNQVSEKRLASRTLKNQACKYLDKASLTDIANFLIDRHVYEFTIPKISANTIAVFDATDFDQAETKKCGESFILNMPVIQKFSVQDETRKLLNAFIQSVKNTFYNNQKPRFDSYYGFSPFIHILSTDFDEVNQFKLKPTSDNLEAALSLVMLSNNMFLSFNQEMKEMILDELRDPITYEVVQIPLVSGGGHTYEKAGIERWFKDHGRSPYTRQESKVCSQHKLLNLIRFQVMQGKIDLHLLYCPLSGKLLENPRKVSFAPENFPYSYDQMELEQALKQSHAFLDPKKDTTPDINLKNIVQGIKQNYPNLPKEMPINLVKAAIERQTYIFESSKQRSSYIKDLIKEKARILNQNQPYHSNGFGL